MKKVFILLAIFFFISGLMFGQTDSIVIPDWYTNQPQKNGVIYGVGRATSPDMINAESKARIIAMNDLVKKTNKVLYSFVSKCDTVLGGNNSSLTIIKSISAECSGILTNVIEKDKKMFFYNNTYVYFYLVEQNTGDAIKLFKNKLKSDKSVKQELEEKGLLKELNDLK
jgi:hypothetical protein